MKIKHLIKQAVTILLCLSFTVSSTVWSQPANTTIFLGEVSLNEVAVLPDLIDPQTIEPLAQLGFDITAPTIAHAPPTEPGIPGEVQTVVAEISDNNAVKQAMLIYRTSKSDQFESTEMKADVTETTWLATVDTTKEDTLVHYYIVAEDTDGNRVQKGSESRPLTLQLETPDLFGVIAPINKNDQKKWIGIGIVGVLVAVALMSSGGSSNPPECCTVTFVVPDVSAE